MSAPIDMLLLPIVLGVLLLAAGIDVAVVVGWIVSVSMRSGNEIAGMKRRTR